MAAFNLVTFKSSRRSRRAPLPDHPFPQHRRRAQAPCPAAEDDPEASPPT